MKTVVGQTEYLYNLMRTAQTRPPTLKFSPALCFLSLLNSKDLCCFEAKGMRKCCLPSYSIVFPSTWQMVVSHTELTGMEDVPNLLLQYFPATLKPLSVFSHRLLQTSCCIVPVTVYYKSQDQCLSFHRPRSGQRELQCSHLCSLPLLHQAFLKEEGSWCQLSIIRWTWVAIMTQHVFVLQQHPKVDVCRRV